MATKTERNSARVSEKIHRITGRMSAKVSGGVRRKLTRTVKTGRISARVSEDVHNTLNRAADIVGSTVNQFLVQSALDRAKAVIEEQSIIRLSGESEKKFFEALENPPVPNQKLKAAFRAHKERL